MTLVLDTSVLISLERKEDKTVLALKTLIDRYPGPASVAFMSYFEYIFGLRMKSGKNRELAVEFIDAFQCLHTTKKTAMILSDLKDIYFKKGRAFSLADLFIAAQTIENNMVLVTSDKKFGEMEELKSVLI